MILPENLTLSKNIDEDLALFFSANSFSASALLCDNNTFKYCYPLVKDHLPDHEVIKIQPGEQFKNLQTCSAIWQKLAGVNMDRNSLFINLGGGVITDMGGFCASIYKRGIPFINIPTTLLAQVDASLGGKLGIDFISYKNYLGVFNHPLRIFINPRFLETLPPNELKSGFAEVLKHGLIADKKYLKILTGKSIGEQNWEEVIPRSIQLKNRIVSEDPLEKGPRKLLNFGHTIGHALESACLSSSVKLLHGEAVAVGMVCESFISMEKGLLESREPEFIKQTILNYFERIIITLDLSKLILKFIKEDKKNVGGRIMCTLLNGIGSALYNQEISEEDIAKSLAFYSK